MDLAGIARRVYKRTNTNSTNWGSSGADLVDAINDACEHCHALIRTKLDNFRPTAFTMSDLSTGTATPKFDSSFHELVPLWIEYQYEKDKKARKNIADEIATKEQEMLRYYGMRAYKPFTVTIAAPGVFTLPSHGLEAGQRVIFLTTGALPTGLSVDTWYYVVSDNLADDTFSVSATKAGTAITTTGSQSGTHYVGPDQAARMTGGAQNNR